MAGAFSGHLIKSLHAQQARQSTAFESQNSNIVTSGAMSFNAQMHGAPLIGNQSMGDYSFSFGSTQPSFFNPELTEATAMKIAALQAKLNQKLGPEYISQRPGPGGGPKLTYAEGWKIINLANEVFGFNGWSSNIVNITTDFIDYNEESKRYNVGATAIVRVTLRDGVFHEDIGYGMLENSKSKGAALDKCKKEAVTDGLKRALRNFGNLMGNCLYDKAYTQEVVKIKVQAPKFDKSELHRRPEFEEKKPNIASSSTSSGTSSRLANTAMNLAVNNTEDIKRSINSTAHSSRLADISLHLPSDNTGTPIKPDNGEQRQTEAKSSIPTIQSSEISAVAGLYKPSNAAGNDLSSARTALSNVSESTSVSRLPPANLKDTKRLVGGLDSFNISLPSADSSEIVKEDGDESYHFGSEDDAFLALVDLGEGDLGQPVLPETDLGRPLFNDNDEADGSQIFESEEAQAQSSLPRERQPYVPAPQTAAQPTGMLSKLLPQNQKQQHRSADQSNPGSRHPEQQLHMKNQNQYHQQQQRSSINQLSSASNSLSRNLNQHAVQRSHRNQNVPPVPNNRTPSVTETRPSTPSMGGFHFPPGVDPRAVQGQGLVSGIGLKRPLESLSSSTNAKPGMGSGAGGPDRHLQIKREVLGNLELGKCGDVKRARR